MSGFSAMRRGLQQRGLIDGQFGLTADGVAYVDTLLQDLAGAEAPPLDPDAPRVFWNLDFRGPRRGMGEGCCDG